MPYETILAALLLAVCVVPLARSLWRGEEGKGAAKASALLLGAVAFTWAIAEYHPAPVQVRTASLRPLEAEGYGYVTSRACKACHPEQYATWHDSWHRTMTQPATPESVLGDFDGVVLYDNPHRPNPGTYVLRRRGDEFWVEMNDPEHRGPGKPQRVERQIVQTTGAHNFQFYWLATGKTRRLELFLQVWKPNENRWMPLDGAVLTPPTKGQEAGTGRWNRYCNKCHATQGRPRVDLAGRGDADDMDTHVSELGIACESCHGPAEEHVAANGDPRRRYALHASGEGDPTIVNPEKLDHKRASEVCGNCHGITVFATDKARSNWVEHGFSFRPGEELEGPRELNRSGELHFWSDGMVRVGGRELNGMVNTDCYTAGEMSCLSCHVMHQAADDPRPRKEWAEDQLKPGMRGNIACTQCHAEYEDESTLAAHTHHPVGSTGSNCYNCHMPYTSYGLLKATRSHTVSSPSALESVATGRPNACNQCHLDQTLAWTAERMSEWYGQPPPRLSAEDRRISAAVNWALRGDAGQRALIAWSMGWDAAKEVSGEDWMVPYLSVMTLDPYHAIRDIAARSLRTRERYRPLDIPQYGAQDQLQMKHSEIMAIWRTTRGALEPEKAARLLLEPRGDWKQAEFELRIAQRDNRDVTLSE